MVPLPASLRIPFLTLGAQQAVAATATDPDCCRVVASDDGTRVTALTSALSMVFDRTDAGGLTELRNEEEAKRIQSRNGDTARYNVFSTQLNDGAWHFERDAAGQIEVLDVIPAQTCHKNQKRENPKQTVVSDRPRDHQGVFTEEIAQGVFQDLADAPPAPGPFPWRCVENYFWHRLRLGLAPWAEGLAILGVAPQP